MTVSPSFIRPAYRLAVDLAIRGVLSLYFAFSAGVYIKNALADFTTGAGSALVVTHVLSILAVSLYTMMIACLYAMRLPPVSRFAGILPCIVAVLGGFLMSGLLFLPPRTDLSLPVQLTGSGLILIGSLATALVLLRLGRSFSILPESRQLVTGGVYKIVRHPVYLAEAITALGMLIHFLSIWAALLVALQFALQLARIHYEEKTLSETFPEYRDYAKRTKRLIPGIY